MIPGLLRSNKVAGLLVASVVLIVLFIGLASNRMDTWDFPSISNGAGAHKVQEGQSSNGQPATATDEEIRNFFIEKLAKPSVKLNAPKYKPFGAFEWKFPEKAKPRWTTPMGKNLCIFDLDNRPFEDKGQIFGDQIMSWDRAEDIHGLSLGVLQHWLYAKIHGYQYYYVKTGDFPDRRASWKKPFIIRKILEKHDTCVYMDSDAIFNHMDLPMEWLMNYWDIDPTTNSLSLSIDPKAEHNKDKKGKLYDNTGFIIAQNRPITFEMMDDWAVCADEGGKHPECTEYRTVAFGRPSDQGGFGNFIRYDYKDEVKELPCAEANGFPEDHSECLGTFVKHLWSGKHDLIKIAIGQQIPGVFLETFHQQLLKEKDSFYLTEEQLNTDEWKNREEFRARTGGGQVDDQT